MGNRVVINRNEVVRIEQANLRSQEIGVYNSGVSGFQNLFLGMAPNLK